MENNQKYALITGASNGIGYELAKQFARAQYNLVLVARTQQDLEACANEITQQFGVEVIPLAKDLFNVYAPEEIYTEITSRGIQIDALVNNAGQGQYGEFADTDINREMDIVQLNIGAYLMLTKCFLKDMLSRGSGKILNVSSIGGKLPGPYQSVYHGTKAFIHSWSEAIRSELKDKGVTVTSLLPGPTDTDFFNKADMQDSKMLEQGMSDPAKVAKDGFDALMAGDDMVISGLKNKAQVGMSNILPDSTVADMINKQAEPKSETAG